MFLEDWLITDEGRDFFGRYMAGKVSLKKVLDAAYKAGVIDSEEPELKKGLDRRFLVELSRLSV